MVGKVNFFVPLGRKFTLHQALESRDHSFPSLASYPKTKKRIRLSFGMARMEVVETIVFPIHLSPNLQGECPAMFLTNTQQNSNINFHFRAK